MVNSQLGHDILRQIQGGMFETRVQLARRLDVSPSTMGIHVDRMVERGWLRERRPEPSSSGRPPKVLELNPDAGQFVGVDLDAREIYAVSVDFAQRRLKERVWEIPRRERAENVLLQMESAIRSVRDRKRPLLGIGIGSPGAVDLSEGSSKHYAFIRDWKNIPLAKRFRDKFGVPVWLENNVRTMALAEQAFGQAKRLDSVICIANRTGIGAGILIHGNLYRGPDGFAGEVGNWPVQLRSGKASTLEQACSLQSLMSLLADHVRRGESSALALRHNRVTWKALLAAAQQNDRLVRKVLAQAATTLGKTMVQMSLMLNPQRLVLCGPLAELQDAFVDPLRESFLAHYPDVNDSIPEICGSQLGPMVGAMGAGAMAARHWTPG